MAQQNEQLAGRGTDKAAKVQDLKETAQKADYLDYAKRRVSTKEAANQAADAGVGFGGSSKGMPRLNRP